MIGFLCNSGTISEYDIKNIIENNKININEIIFFSEFDTEINYQNFPIKFVKIQNFINLEHINLKNWDWFSHIPFLDPQFFDIFPKFEDLSIWWTIDIHCYLSIRNLLKTINILDKITLDYSEIQKIYLIKFPVEFKILKKYYPK